MSIIIYDKFHINKEICKFHSKFYKCFDSFEDFLLQLHWATLLSTIGVRISCCLCKCREKLIIIFLSSGCQSQISRSCKPRHSLDFVCCLTSTQQFAYLPDLFCDSSRVEYCLLLVHLQIIKHLRPCYSHFRVDFRV